MNRKLLYVIGIELAILFLFLTFSRCGSNDQASEQTQTNITVVASEKKQAVKLGAEQLILSILPNDSTIQGTMFLFEKRGIEWINPKAPFPITVGRTGIAPGKGIHDPTLLTSIAKKEGDGKSPSGIYRLGMGFGYAKENPNPDWSYWPLDDQTQCIEDSRSRQYNKIIDPTKVEKDFDQSDFMLRDDNLYKWGIFVDHNKEQAPQGGSCIFLHIWRAEDKPTAGCTAMTEENMYELLKWVKESKNPLFVQLTEQDYPIFQEKYELPEMTF